MLNLLQPLLHRLPVVSPGSRSLRRHLLSWLLLPQLVLWLAAAALGYVADGHAVLPSEFGYFLAESWRMHSAVTAPVSRLSYDGELRSNPAADERMLHGIAPGVHPVAVHHRPVQGTRGPYRVNLRHGVSRVRSGHRHLGGL